MLHANYKVEWTECDELVTDPRYHDIGDLASTIRRVALTQQQQFCESDSFVMYDLISSSISRDY